MLKDVPLLIPRNERRYGLCYLAKARVTRILVDMLHEAGLRNWVRNLKRSSEVKLRRAPTASNDHQLDLLLIIPLTQIVRYAMVSPQQKRKHERRERTSDSGSQQALQPPARAELSCYLTNR